jgi:hypothetical protein
MGFGSSRQSSQNQAQQTSQSSNQAFPFLQSSLGGQVSNVGRGSNAIADILGLNGASGQTDGFQRFKDSSGYDFIKQEGIRGIDASNASKGLRNSGSAYRGITKYSSDLATNFLNSYLAQLAGLSNTGIQAGQVISNAGQTSTSQGTSSGSSTRFQVRHRSG